MIQVFSKQGSYPSTHIIFYCAEDDDDYAQAIIRYKELYPDSTIIRISNVT